MVYEESAMAAIVTFLQRANPYYRQTEASQDKELEQANLLYGQLLDLVVRLVMRLCTGKFSRQPSGNALPKHSTSQAVFLCATSPTCGHLALHEIRESSRSIGQLS